MKIFQNRDVAVSVRKGWCGLFQYKGKLIVFKSGKYDKHQSWSPGHESTSAVRPTAPIHGGDPHGGAGAAHPVPSHHRLVQGSSEVLSYHHQDQALAGIVLRGDAGSSHQRFKNLKRTTFSSDINEITSSTKCNILNVGPVPVQYLFLYPGLHQKKNNILHGFCCLE